MSKNLICKGHDLERLKSKVKINGTAKFLDLQNIDPDITIIILCALDQKLLSEMAYGELWPSSVALLGSYPWYVSFMLACKLEFVIMAQYPSLSQSQTVLNKDASWRPHCLASCSRQCYQMPSGMGMLESKSIQDGWQAIQS